ncbi:DUF3592 domain-containing protein [Micromonospora auratinigra]|uniref:DUF3592 domain-containing protein n=1 Tax=Micromonospora auratinigra TaxID=261654 RepID=A0A1A9A9Q1_9ACTN|nr:DUF3592 domain-containing protein [Micromonospora auratinigra]SBT52833.1 Protein of unknown function (DUF3592) [Micromonospora auratinigra]
MGVVFLLGGLSLAVASAGYMWRVSEKADRLRAEGVPVQAVVSDFYDGSGRGSGPDTITVTYEYEGSHYQQRILCAGATGCHRDPPAEMTVWVDPSSPAQFVAANGNTDDSAAWLNRWTKILIGGLFAVLGAVLLVVALFGDRLLARSRRRAGKG